MICSFKAPTLAESEFLNGKGLKRRHSQAVTDLIASGLSLDMASDILQKSWESCVTSAESEDDLARALELASHRPPYQTVLSEEAAQAIAKCVRLHYDEGGNPSWFLRTSDKAEVYKLAGSLSSGLRATINQADSPHRRLSTTISRLHQADKLWHIRIHGEDGELGPPMSRSAFAQMLAGAEQDTIGKAMLDLVRAEFQEKKLGTWRLSVPSIEDFDAEIVRGMDSPGQRLLEDGRMFLPQFPAVISNKTDVPCFTYIAREAISAMPTPAFDEWLTIVHPDCREVFKAAVFAPFHDQCRHRKVTWLHSDGYDGKSTFFNALNRYSGGNMVVPIGSSNLSGEFGQESLVGKRMLLWADAQNVNALSSNLFHNVTGGDVVLINRKNQKHISYRYNAMVFVASNSAPELKAWQRNEMTRLIYVRFNPPTDAQLKAYCMVDEQGNVLRYSDGTPKLKGSDLEERLIEEMPGILHKCSLAYRELCPSPHRDIVIPDASRELMLLACGHDAGDRLSHFAEEQLEFGESYTESMAEVHQLIRKNPMTKDLGDNEIRRWLVSHGATIGKSTRGGRIYIGCRIKP